MKNAAVYLQDPVSEEKTLINLFDKEAVIGSSGSADIHLNDFRCNGIHAFIQTVEIQDDDQQKHDFYLLDLGSQAGTVVNGKRVKEAYLKSGDTIVIGSTNLLIQKIPKSLSNLQMFLEKGAVSEEDEKVEAKLPSLVTERNLLQASLYWGQGLLEVRTFSTGAEVTIGSKKGATFGVTVLDKGLYRIASYKNRQVDLHIPAIAEGLVWLGDSAYTIEELRERQVEENKTGEFSIVLRIGDRADIKIGELVICFQFVLPAEKVARFAKIKMDKKLLKILGGLFAAYFLFFMFLLWTPEQEEKKVAEVPKKLKKVLFKAGMEWAKKRQQSAIGQKLSEQGGRAKSKEGAAKAKKAPPPKVTKKVEKTSKVVSSKKVKPKKDAREQKKPETVDLNAVFGEKSSESIVDTVALSGPTEKGTTLGAMTSGQFARGSSGFDSGGGGAGVGIGQMKGLSTGGGMGAGDYGVEVSKGKEIDISVEEEVVLLEGLDPEVISAVIRRYLPQIQHCYEMQLVSKPKLQGKVLVKFQIMGDGTVNDPRVVESTLGDEPAHKCILAKVKKWIFPKPRGGGTVDVKYPFLLMSTSGQ